MFLTNVPIKARIELHNKLVCSWVLRNIYNKHFFMGKKTSIRLQIDNQK